MVKKLTAAQIEVFQKRIHRHYYKHGRSFPWRETHDPYCILVSEIMLQQTQAGLRTIEKYKEFIKKFPNVCTLATALLREVLTLWQGLGYNRRAKALWEAAQIIVEDYEGVFPREASELVKLPGIGVYTAAAVVAFAFNQPVILLETNIRTVFIYHFLKEQTGIPDTALIPLIEATLDHKNPRIWYAALMDYGVMLKGTVGNMGKQSKHYTKQGSFVGSDREIRGKILRALVGHTALSAKALTRIIEGNDQRVGVLLSKLAKEGLVKRKRQLFLLG